jgi:predicted dehydrogenase
VKLRAGVIGLGVGERHIGCYESHPECEVAAICDIDADRLAEVSARHPGARRFSDASELLNDPDIDLVSIASYDDVHYEQCKLAIENGKHVYVEKPLCLYREHADELRAMLVENPEVRFSSNHVLRLSSRFGDLKRQIEEGEFGDVYYLEGDYQFGRLEKITEGWRGSLPFYSVVYGGAIHMIDLLMWMTSDEIVEVSAYGNDISSRGTKFHYNDMVVAICKMKSGAIAKVSANFGCQRPHFHALEVHGTEQVFINRPGDAELWDSTERDAVAHEVDTEYRDYKKPYLIHSFLDWIRGVGLPIVSPEDVFRAMSVCFAIEEAVASGKPTRVPK